MAEIQHPAVAAAPVFDVLGPAVTAPATLDQRDVFGRQNNFDSCGYYSLSRNDWASWQCGEPGNWTTTCNTIGSHFGCFPTIYTTCSNSADGCNTNDKRALCCNSDSTYQYCATGIKTLEDGDGEELSVYICAQTEQQLPFYESTIVKVTSDSTTKEQTLSEIDTTKGITIITKTAGASDPSDTEDPDDGDDGGSSTPVGAIVGGVVGGVALIAILGLAFWFIRRKKQNQTPAPAPLPGAPGISPQQQPQQMAYQQQGVPPPVVYDYNNPNNNGYYAGYQSPPPPGSPPPNDPRYSQMPVGGMVSPTVQGQSPPPAEQYKPVASPVSELPVTEPAPPSELPADMGTTTHTTPK